MEDKNSLGKNDQMNTEYNRIIRIFDTCFGGFSILIVILSFVLALQGENSWLTFFLMLNFVIINLILSQFSLKSKNSKLIEIFRMFVFNALSIVFAYIFSDGIFTNYWPGFLIASLGTGVLITSWSQTRMWSYLQTLFWIALLALSNFIIKPNLGLFTSLKIESFFIIASLIIMASILIIQIMWNLNLTLKSESEAKARLFQSTRLSTLGEMAGGLAHEINTPLATIKLLSEQLQEIICQEQETNKDFVKDITTDLIKTSDRISKIVMNLRSFARDASEDSLKIVKVKQLIEDTLSLCHERFTVKQINLSIDTIDPQLNFKGRKSEISQVLLNLLNNSCDAISNQEQKWIKITVSTDQDDLIISIIDSGPRISKELQEKLFQPFFTTKKIGTGGGLALSVSLGIIKSHSGELKLDTDYKNTKFDIRLPRNQRVKNTTAA